MSRTQEKITKTTTKHYIGIDVGKQHLDVYIHPGGTALRVNNNAAGIRKLVLHCKGLTVQLVGLEATGIYHRLVHETLHDAGMPVAVINPFRSRTFADSMGLLAKTDTIDAQMLAQFAERMQPEASVPPLHAVKNLRELHTARRQALKEAGDLKRQLHTTEHPIARKQIQARIKMVDGHRRILDKEISQIVSDDREMKRKYAILTSIPGIGTVTATTMLADLAELGQANAKEIAALAGVAPMNWDSGAKRGNRMIRGGRQSVRNSLYMCAVCCSGKSSSLGVFYRNLIQRGKNPKVALTAVMRKLVVLANTLVTEDRLWQPSCP
ncbi:MAG: IS110 family transposase [Alphaproteobacteria bacterium]|nr:IS110 family transposase [Alphaproteobacteria bacterium]